MLERRKLHRDRTYLGGVIAFNQRCSAMDCLVRDFSANGVKVVFTNTAAVPDDFDLTIRQKGRTYRARMAWRRGNEAGACFLSQDATIPPISLEWVRRLRACEAEKAVLLQRIDRLSNGW